MLFPIEYCSLFVKFLLTKPAKKYNIYFNRFVCVKGGVILKIAVIGMGLIGGSFCKTLKKNTKHAVFGFDKDNGVTQKALSEEAIDKIIAPEELQECDMSVVCLHPEQTIDFILENLDNFKSGTIVFDVCGVKKSISDAVEAELLKKGVYFVGTHPMAGREFSGYDYSLDTMFDNASFIIAKTEFTNATALETVKTVAEEMKFKRIVISTPEQHDSIIAFTSQLAHIVSNAYIKSPTLQNRSGYSAGSFLDMTRVAKLNEDMWTSLFMMNKAPLVYEIDTIIENLERYRDALQNSDSATLKTLLREGRIIKENSLEAGDK